MPQVPLYLCLPDLRLGSWCHGRPGANAARMRLSAGGSSCRISLPIYCIWRVCAPCERIRCAATASCRASGRASRANWVVDRATSWPPSAFRQRLIAQQLDRRLLERTVELAATNGAFGPRQLRAALDSSPLWGVGRVEDTYNLLGHALRKALRVIARQQGRGLRAVAEEAGASLVAGPSLKAALDLD
jgi:hypothetical protein